MHDIIEKYKKSVLEIDAHGYELAIEGDLKAIWDLHLDELTELELYMIALNAGHVQLLQKLTAQTKNQLLILTAYNGLSVAVKALLKYRSVMQPMHIISAFNEAATFGFDNVVRMLLDVFKQEIPQQEISKALQRAILNNQIPMVWVLLSKEQFGTLYRLELPVFAKLITPRKKGQQIGCYFNPVHHQTVFNQRGYDEGINQDWAQHFTEGRALTLPDGTPIGYNVFLPNHEVKAVCVRVYGGIESFDRKDYLYRPDLKDILDLQLLDQGIAVVKLNLVDLLELQTYQLRMPQKLHDKLHASIHEFYKTIQYAPFLLHSTLRVLQDKPCYLMGGSFGGTMAVRHAQKYPGTFKGYISLDGELSIINSFETNKFDDVQEPDEDIEQAQYWLCPTFDVHKLQDPLLILHNADDNNVTLPVALDFMKKAKKAGKKDLVRLLVTDHGSPVNETEPENAGHHLPEDKKSFERIASTLISFMLDGPTSLQSATAWREHKYRLYSHQENPSASLVDKFKSWSFTLYQEDLWGEDKNSVSFCGILSHDKVVKEAAWHSYARLYRVLYYLDKLSHDDREYRKCKNKLPFLRISENAFKRALVFHKTRLVQFLKEKYNLADSVTQAMLQEDAMLDDFKYLVLNPSESCQTTYLFLLTSLFMANPELIEDETKHLTQSPEGQAQVRQAIESVIEAINKNKAKMRSLWKEAAKEGLRLKSASKDVPPLDFYQRRQIIFNAASTGDLKQLKSMLEDKQNPVDNQTKEQAFSDAVLHNKILVALYLLNKCADAIGKTEKIEALKWTTQYQNKEMFDLLMKYYGKNLKQFELMQALGAKRAQMYLKEQKPTVKRWPTVVIDADTNSSQERIQKVKRPLPQTPLRELQLVKPLQMTQAIRRPLPIRPQKVKLQP